MKSRQFIHIEALMLGHPRSLRIALSLLVVIVFMLACSDAPSPPGAMPTSQPTAQLTLLTLNLKGVTDQPYRNADGNWKFRYMNVGSGLKAVGVVPDVIALQEVNAWTWCTFNYSMIPDYAPLDELLTALENGTGVQYRIAYLNALTPSSGNFHQTVVGIEESNCQAMSGLALLYNPQRIRNLMTNTTVGDAAMASAHDAAPQEGAHLQRSLPICNPAGGSLVASRIDGPAQTDKCNRETPGGLAWITGTRSALARLEFVDRPGAEFHVYNVHLNWNNQHADDVSAVNDMVTALEQRFGTSRWIPPIIMGDFNTHETDQPLDEFPLFEYRGRATDNDWILAGKSASYPAAASIIGHVTTEMPRGHCFDPQAMWSDHCAVLTGLTIQ